MITIRQILFISVVLPAVFFSSLQAGSGDRWYTNAFLEIPLGARATGLGGAYAGVANDGTAFFWNPAGITLLHKREISMMYADQFDGFGQYHFINYSHKLSETYGFSVSWIRYSVGSIAEYKKLVDNVYARSQPDYDFSQYSLGHFDYADNAFFFSFARMNKFYLNMGWLYSDFPVQIPVGVNFKILKGGTSGISGENETVLSDAKKFGIGVDLGAMLMFGVNDLLEAPYLGDFAAGINLQDLTTTGVTYNSASSISRQQQVKPRDVAPLNVKFGLSYIQPIDELESNVLIAYEHNNRYGATSHYGLEYDYKRMIQIRLGYNHDKITYGAGLSVWQFQIDYAIISHDLGYTHRVSAAYKF